GCAAAAIKAFVNHRAITVKLGKVITIEVRIAAIPRVGQIDIGQLATGKFVHLAAIGFDPIIVAQSPFVGDGNDGYVACVGAIGIRADFDDGLFARCALEQLVNVVLRGQIASLDRQQVFAYHDVDARLRKRGAQVGVPVFAVINFGEAVAPV